METNLKKFFNENKELLEKTSKLPEVEFNETNISLIYSDVDMDTEGDSVYENWCKEIEEEIFAAVGIHPTPSGECLKTWYILLDDIVDTVLVKDYEEYKAYESDKLNGVTQEFLDINGITFEQYN